MLYHFGMDAMIMILYCIQNTTQLQVAATAKKQIALKKKPKKTKHILQIS